VGIYDKIHCKLYPSNLMSLIHLGASMLKLFCKDLHDAKLEMPKNKVLCLGLPDITALYSHCISEFQV